MSGLRSWSERVTTVLSIADILLFSKNDCCCWLRSPLILPLGELLGTYILESALNTLSVIYDSALAASVTSNYRNSTGTLIRTLRRTDNPKA